MSRTLLYAMKLLHIRDESSSNEAELWETGTCSEPPMCHVISSSIMKQCAHFNISAIVNHWLSLWHLIIRNEISQLMVYHICQWRTKPCNNNCSDCSEERWGLDCMVSSYRLVRWVVVLIHKLPWCKIGLNTCGVFNNEIYETESEDCTAFKIWC